MILTEEMVCQAGGWHAWDRWFCGVALYFIYAGFGAWRKGEGVGSVGV